MSSNKQHIQIDCTNYEEFFLLYTDGELTPEQCDAVEAFAAAHPGLQEELDILLATKLDAESISFNDKEVLLSQNMQATAADELLLLYIDNELPVTDKTEIERRIKDDAVFHLQYLQWQATKLNAETIVYPNKKELYRSTERAVRPIYWMRIAVAVVLLLGSSFFWWKSQDTSAPTGPATIAHTPPVKKQLQKTVSEKKIKQPIIEQPSTNEIAFVPKEAIQPITKHLATIEKKPIVIEEPIQLPVTDAGDRVTKIPSINPPVSVDAGGQTIPEPSSSHSQQTINNHTVTIPVIPPYHNKIEDGRETGVIYASSTSNDKKGSVRGFLRKATRFIERRTGINPVNEDNELLVGVVAIKL